MKRTIPFMVTNDYGPRPAGKPDECFYCHVKVGGEHLPECVMRRRIVMVEAKFVVPVLVPEAYSFEHIDFYFNEGSWCASNFLTHLDAFDGEDRCLCRAADIHCLREATCEDLELFGITDPDEQMLGDSLHPTENKK